MTSFWSLVATLLVAVACKLAFDTWRVLRSITLPYRVVFFGPKNMVVNHFLPRIPWICRGDIWSFDDQHSAFQENGTDVFVTVSFWPWVTAVFHLADPVIVKETLTSRIPFIKPVNDYGAMLHFGPNIIATEGAEWKKHRKVCAPAFSEPTNRLVWSETIRICEELYEEIWQQRDFIHCDNIVKEFSLPIALHVLSAASWGRRVSWKADDVPGKGKQNGFRDALCKSSENMALKTALPSWVFRLTKGLREADQAFKDLGLYLTEMIEERRASPGLDRHDLFSKLLASCEEERSFTEQDVIGNLFVFTLAGHETTAHTLAFALGLLALYPEEQDKLYRHITSVVPSGTTPTYDDMASLPRVLAVYYETLRLYPTVLYLPKRCQEDVCFTTTDQTGDPVSVFIPKGSTAVICNPGLHYNVRYWDRPTEFCPDRFLGDWPRSAFIPFSQGPHSCLGRRFFETEGVAILTTLIMKYKVSIMDEPEFVHETFEERKARVMAGKTSVSFAPSRLPITFTRRDRERTQ